MNRPRQPTGPCPQCGKPDGQRYGNSEWAHGYMCCSTDCGVAFRDSRERCGAEIQRLRQEIAYMQSELKVWRERLAGRASK